ncbi:hypothetical protein Tco_0215706 [Tanacetum coccineum]
MPRGTTQVVTRGASNDCVSDVQVPGTVAVRGGRHVSTSVVTKKVVGDISEHDVLMPNLLPTLPFSSENEDKVFNPGIFSSPFSSHRAKITFDFSKNPMMIFGGDIPHLDVPYLHFYPT